MKKLIPLLLLLLLFAGCLGDKIKYEVNSSKCNGCNKCVVQCPVNAITVINGDSVFTNLAYEIEYKNSDACEVPQEHEQPGDLTTSFNEDGEYFSRC